MCIATALPDVLKPPDRLLPVAKMEQHCTRFPIVYATLDQYEKKFTYNKSNKL
jgi:hypothetical protein